MTETENQNIQETSGPGQPGGQESFGFGKLIFLGIISVILCTFGPLSIFAPVPLAMAVLLYGRVRTTFLAVAMAFILFAFSLKSQAMISLSALYVLAYFFSVLVAEIILRNVDPVKGLFRAGIVLLGIMLVLLGVFVVASDISIEQYLYTAIAKQFTAFKQQNAEFFKAGGQDAKLLKDLLEKPENVVSEFLQWSPSFLVVLTFGGLWVSLGVVLRNALVWKEKLKYPYQLGDLFKFRVPDYFVWPLIFGLSLTLGAEYIHPKAAMVGGNVLYCLGVFYFFQGFGILSDFLTSLRIYGFLRTILIIVSVITGLKLLVAVGVFDMWFNFRRFFAKKNETENNDDEGDIE